MNDIYFKCNKCNRDLYLSKNNILIKYTLNCVCGGKYENTIIKKEIKEKEDSLCIHKMVL